MALYSIRTLLSNVLCRCILQTSALHRQSSGNSSVRSPTRPERVGGNIACSISAGQRNKPNRSRRGWHGAKSGRRVATPVSHVHRLARGVVVRNQDYFHIVLGLIPYDRLSCCDRGTMQDHNRSTKKTCRFPTVSLLLGQRRE